MIVDGSVAALDPPDGDLPVGIERIDAAGRIVAPGLVDLGTELREPGRDEDETIASGASAALVDKVTEQDVAEVVGKWTGIPVSRLMEGEIQKLLRMETRLHERVIGQDEAIVAVANAIRRARAGLQDPNRPLGSFIFLGPTGVGKSLLALGLAKRRPAKEVVVIHRRDSLRGSTEVITNWASIRSTCPSIR